MAIFEEYKRQSEPDKRKKAENWGVAIGLQQVDGLNPSKYLISLARDNIEGKISVDQAAEQVHRYYKQNPAQTTQQQDEREADEVSVRIARLLSTHTFSFSPAEYISIHKSLFSGGGGDDVAGQVRTYDITKKEPILNNDTVVYGRADCINEMLKYDFEQEKLFNYAELTKRQQVEHLAKFMSGIWQIHPFAEGNTRAIAIFIIKYMYTLGFETNNDLFECHSEYFRNALVRANYQNVRKGIPYTMEYLNHFFGNLLLNENNILDSRIMQIKEDTVQKTVQKTGKTVQKILKHLMENPKLTRKELSELVGITERGVKWNLDKLKTIGKICRVGPDKGGYWQVLD